MDKNDNTPTVYKKPSWFIDSYEFLYKAYLVDKKPKLTVHKTLIWRQHLLRVFNWVVYPIGG